MYKYLILTRNAFYLKIQSFDDKNQFKLKKNLIFMIYFFKKTVKINSIS